MVMATATTKTVHVQMLSLKMKTNGSILMVTVTETTLMPSPTMVLNGTIPMGMVMVTIKTGIQPTAFPTTRTVGRTAIMTA